MIRFIRIGMAAAVLLGGCDPRFVYQTNLSPRELQALTGTWEGSSSLSREETRGCPTFYVWVLRVANGNVEGDLVDRDTPNAPHTKFTTFLDYDGTISALIRPRGQDMKIQGVFQRDSFAGETHSAGCSYRVRLRRTSSS